MPTSACNTTTDMEACEDLKAMGRDNDDVISDSPEAGQEGGLGRAESGFCSQHSPALPYPDCLIRIPTERARRGPAREAGRSHTPPLEGEVASLTRPTVQGSGPTPRKHL
ncbi:hypothetical protein AAFF_G00391200 [Aldrovandia affinis]|uniref:Uncharacterized protein n=1 Tax=Aldrovandia affinis TaxID=143900 RepID=A0AAD7WKV5_9TELE|nr:hypothetical protein AAFF_G00391200 [Aldrovandia affinis]